MDNEIFKEKYVMVQIFILIALYLLFNLADAFGDVAIEKGKQSEWHFWGTFTAGMFYSVISYIQFGLTWQFSVALFLLILLRFPVFNLLHNLRKSDKWNYLSDKGIDGFVKRLFNLKK